jgi:predicted dehydrogenase
MTKRVRVAVVGAGGIAQVYRQVFETSDEAEVTVVVDPDHAAAERMAAALGAETAPDHTALLDRATLAKFDAALVCSPPSTHAAIAGDLLEVGRPVLCEKPLALSIDQASSMAERAVAAGVPLLMASKYRYVADVARAKVLIEDGVIGTPVLVETAFTGKVDMTRRWNSRPEVSGGGVIMDNGTHAVDILRFLIGPVTAVLAVEGPRIQSLEVEDTAWLFARTSEGIRGHADLTWSLDKRLPDYTVVHGTEGVVRLGWRRSVLQRPGQEDEVIGDGYDKVVAIRDGLTDFLNLVGGAAARITIEDALASVSVLDAAYRSLKTGTWDTVTPSDTQDQAVQAWRSTSSAGLL